MEIVLEIIVDKIGEINNEPVDCGITEKDETIDETKIELCNCEDKFESLRNDFWTNLTESKI